ncbi:ketopantoate reductase [Mangrovimicrobium sediminis]|uniref:Ketopantoate reductase n=1 Tax=Mangrovimicrobium sediminis TaxID=2562682 RepID=A0A4Z0LXA3_9GAMM|nr:2-dehydropantoate 2-reductase N-terminal domain-containing protein [Haliea sp. SAOS-164]TGD71909.1 ketopantoate reductase [Haliea sp. SAOS-164]
MSGHRVLIVGAGALGLTTGYFLRRSGAELSFLVRPHRVEALTRPQTLYSYDEQTLKTLDGYEVFTDAAELRGDQFDFVLLTLDGATCRSAQGTETLRALGAALAVGKATLLICAVGTGLYQHVQKTTGLPASRLLEGTMKIFAYQVGQEGAPQPGADQAQLHDSADIAYINFPDRVGFFVTSKPAAPAKAFIELFSGSGEATCKSLPTGIYRISTNTFAPFTVSCELAGWPDMDTLVADRELWRLCCQAQREIMRLKQHGLQGKLMALFMSDKRMEKLMRDSERDAAPMGFAAFNRFHHGGKVLEQNVQILENCLSLGVEGGQKMDATRALVERWRRQHL